MTPPSLPPVVDAEWSGGEWCVRAVCEHCGALPLVRLGQRVEGDRCPLCGEQKLQQPENRPTTVTCPDCGRVVKLKRRGGSVVYQQHKRKGSRIDTCSRSNHAA
jgi:ssDNA-binding Zn-finger/Zn-ribbon topoisomerase 1